MSFLRSCLLVLACLALTSPVWAQGINKEGAVKLKTIVQDFVTQQKKLAEVDGMTKIMLQGDTTVEEAGDYYAVTLPYMKVIHPDGDQIDLGMVSINASPATEPAQWKMRVAVPTPIIVTDKSGKEVSRLTIGGQRAAGIWDEGLQSFVKLDAMYKDTVFNGEKAVVTVPETQILYDFSKDAGGKWSGPGSITLKNVSAIDKAGNPLLKIGELKVSFTIDQYNSDAISAYRKKLASLSEKLNAPDAAKGVTPDRATAIADMLMEFFANAGNGAKVRYEFSGFELHTISAPGQTITIPHGFSEVELGGLLAGKLRFTTKLGYNGLTVNPPMDAEHNLTPSDVNLDIVIENIPIREILDLAKNTLTATVQQPDMKQFAAISFLAKVPALLSQSGTFLTINDTHIGNADIDMKLEGRARADISAVNSATAEAKATFRGLDTLLERLKAQQNIVSAQQSQKLQETIGQLESIKKHARVEKTPDGQTLHVIDFSMTPQGQVLLNGEDLTKLKAQDKQGIAKPAPVPAAEPGQPLTP